MTRFQVINDTQCIFLTNSSSEVKLYLLLVFYYVSSHMLQLYNHCYVIPNIWLVVPTFSVIRNVQR